MSEIKGVRIFLSVRNIYSRVNVLFPKLSVSIMEQTLVETLLEIRNALIEFVLFSRRKDLEGAVKPSFSQMLFQPNSCFVGMNLS